MNFGQRFAKLFFECPIDFSFGFVQLKLIIPHKPSFVLILNIPRVSESSPD